MSNRKLYKKLNHDVPQVTIPPVEMAWQQMEVKLNERRRRRGFFVIGSVMMAALLITLIIYQPGTHNHSSETSQKSSTGDLTASDRENGPGKNRLPEDSVHNLALSTLISPSADFSNQKNNKFRTAGTGISADRKSRKAISGRKERITSHAPAGTRSQSDSLRAFSVSGEENVSAKDSFFGQENVSAKDSVSDNENVSDKGIVSDKKTDSSKGNEADKPSEDEEKLRIEAGLQWTLQAPFSGSALYFSGPQGKPEPYRVLYPGIWINVVSQRKMATLTWTPFASAVFGRSPYAAESFTDPRGAGERSYTLHKVFGSAFSLGGSWNWQGRWWMGGQISGMFWKKATGTVSETINGAHSRQENYAVSAADWSGFAKFQPGLGVNLVYRGLRWQAGGRFTVNLVPVSDVRGQQNQVSLELFARLALWSSH